MAGSGFIPWGLLWHLPVFSPSYTQLMTKIWHALFLVAGVFVLVFFLIITFCLFWFLFVFHKLVCVVCNASPPHALFSFFSFMQLQLEVHEAKPVPENHPQWDTAIEGDEDQEDSEGFEDSFEEEEEEEDDDD